jgi:hypothetical protein
MEGLDLDSMLKELIEEIYNSSAYYSDIPYVIDLLQGDPRFIEYRRLNGLLKQSEKE